MPVPYSRKLHIPPHIISQLLAKKQEPPKHNVGVISNGSYITMRKMHTHSHVSSPVCVQLVVYKSWVSFVCVCGLKGSQMSDVLLLSRIS